MRACPSPKRKLTRPSPADPDPGSSDNTDTDGATDDDDNDQKQCALTEIVVHKVDLDGITFKLRWQGSTARDPPWEMREELL